MLRWLDALSLEGLERCVLRSRMLQRFMLCSHERAFRKLLAGRPGIGRVGIVGGGLYPRTALVLERVLPGARLVLIDKNPEHLAVARRFVNGDTEFIHDFFDPSRESAAGGGAFDLVVVPLAFVGDRAGLYRHPPAPVVLVHDWIWHRRGRSRIISFALLKRVNLVERASKP